MNREEFARRVLRASTLDEYAALSADIGEDHWLWADYTVLFRRLFDFPLKRLAFALAEATASGAGQFRTLKTLESYEITATKFAPDQRVYKISFSLYRLAAYSRDPFRWARLAHEQGLSVRKLKAAIEVGEGEQPSGYKKSLDIVPGP